jgi:ubiquinone/menaquinone biosynthesis C-methylase UbiE
MGFLGSLMLQRPLAGCVVVDYAKRAREYDPVRADVAVDRDFWLSGLRDIGQIRNGERVLDLGAGTGRFAALLHPAHRVVAVDASREMLAVAGAKAAFPCVRGDAHRLPLGADSFDVTLLVMVLHHLRSYGAALQEVARVSRRIVIATTDMTRRRLGILEEAFPSLLEIDRRRFPSIGAIRQALTVAGFGGIRVEERPYLRTFTAERQLDRVRRRYLSTFDLLPPGEFERGMGYLERELPRRFAGGFPVRASFTFLAGTR